MASVPIDGSAADLEHFSRNVAAGSATVEVLGPRERRLRWARMERSGSITSTALRSGIALSLSTVRWDRPWAMSVDHGASSIKLILTRGAGPELTTSDGDRLALGGGLLHVGQIKRPVRLDFHFDEQRRSADHEQLSLEIERGRLAELLGAAALPEPIERVLASPRAYPTAALPMGPALFRLFDEVAGCDARGSSRPLRLEALGLELLAALIDRIEESADAASPHLTAHDRDRLERARRILLARLDDPPSLHALARAAGINEFKLKAGFRALFGSPVYAYLRDQRMEEARRLLLARRHTVTEVAARVGYANPSKFAAAFRRRFGVSPTDAA